MVKKFRATPFEIKLDEAAAGGERRAPRRIQVIRTGTFHHPEYGKMVITKDHLNSFVRNFNEKVRGIDLSVDVAHESEREAAAWFKELVVDGEALFAEVDWTPFGEKKVADKEFRYVSADFHLDYQDTESLKKYGPTLLGAGLTNRPFIKKMEPVVQLSEFNGGAKMDLAQAMAKIAELEQQIAALKNGGAESPEMAEMKKQMGALQAQCAELTKEVDGYKAKEVESEKAAKLAEKKGKFDKLLSEGKAVEAQREAYMSGDADKYAELAMDPKSKRLSEEANGDEGGETDAEDKILKLAEKAVKDGKAKDLGTAVTMILDEPEHAELAKAYNNRFKLQE